MKKKLLFCTLIAFCASQAWGMSPDVRAGQIMRDIERQRGEMQQVAQNLGRLQAEQSQLQEELDDPELLAFQTKLKEAEEDIENAKALIDLAEEDDEKRRALTRFQDAEFNICSFTDRVKGKKKAMRFDEKLAELEALGGRIQEAQEDERRFREAIAGLESNLAEIPEDHRLQAELAAAQRAGEVGRDVSFENWKARRAKQQERLSRVMPEVEGLPKFFEEAMQSPAPAPKSQSAIGKKTGGAGIVMALAIAITTYIGRRMYQKKKERLMRKYKLASLTPLQNNVWRAVALAHIRMPWYLQYLIKNNTGTIADFIGSDPRAAAELYYGRVPNEAEVKAFQGRFFGNVQ